MVKNVRQLVLERARLQAPHIALLICCHPELRDRAKRRSAVKDLLFAVSSIRSSENKKFMR